jgi:hypothetical protein
MGMNFVEYMPKVLRGMTTDYQGDKVRLKLVNVKGKAKLYVYIGKDVAKKYGFAAKDKVKIWMDQDNKFFWALEKDPRGWSLAKTGNSLVLQLGWEGMPAPQALVDARYMNIALAEGKLTLCWIDPSTLTKDNEA